MTHWRVDIAWKSLYVPMNWLFLDILKFPPSFLVSSDSPPKARWNQTVIYSFVYLQTKKNFYFYFTAVKGCSTNSSKSGKVAGNLSPHYFLGENLPCTFNRSFVFVNGKVFFCSRERHRGSRAHKQAKQTDYNAVVIASGGNEMGNNVLWLHNSSNYMILMRFSRRLKWKWNEWMDEELERLVKWNILHHFTTAL